MAPTLSPLFHEEGKKDSVLLKKWKPLNGLKRGDVVAFWSPVKENHLVVKRVIGLEGDLVWVQKKKVVGKPLGREFDEVGRGRIEGGIMEIERDVPGGLGRARKKGVRVPFGHVWVEGDNWRASQDSNDYGPLSKSLITGRAIAVFLPFSRFWSKPWEKITSKTKVQHGESMRPVEWNDL